ncbi:MAG TPA: RNA methyltransferase, partial [Anaerolineae bacterium]
LQHQSEARASEKLFVAEGARLTDDFLRAGMQPAFALIGPQAAAQLWRQHHPDVECLDVTEVVMKSVSIETTPPGIVVVFHQPDHQLDTIRQALPTQILILDAIRDPGNLGACLRVAAGADCRLVLLAPGCVDPFNPKVVRGGMGAHVRLQVVSASWDEIRQINSGRDVWAADANGSLAYDRVQWTKPNALIIGSEATGLSADARDCATGLVTIPLANQLESLNAAVACGVMLFEAARQRRAG